MEDVTALAASDEAFAALKKVTLRGLAGVFFFFKSFSLCGKYIYLFFCGRLFYFSLTRKYIWPV